MPTIAINNTLFDSWSYASRHPFITAGILIALLALIILQAWFTRRYAPRQWALSLLLGAGYLAFATPGMYILFEEHQSELSQLLERTAASAELCKAATLPSQPHQELTPERAAAIVEALKYYEFSPRESK